MKYFYTTKSIDTLFNSLKENKITLDQCRSLIEELKLLLNNNTFPYLLSLVNILVPVLSIVLQVLSFTISTYKQATYMMMSINALADTAETAFGSMLRNAMQFPKSLIAILIIYLIISLVLLIISLFIRSCLIRLLKAAFSYERWLMFKYNGKWLL